jgi:hypothetical protein
MNPNEKTDQVLLSQLADGELDSEQVNDVLLQVLDDEAAREQLKRHLGLRKSLGPWRGQRPARPLIVKGVVDPLHHRLWFSRLGGLAAAAMVGGVLVGAGFLLATLGGRGQPGADESGTVAVTAQERADLAAAFRLHESVAGPLAAYAADEDSVQLVSAEGPQLGGQPVGIMLRLGPADQPQRARTYTIACRADHAATMKLPGTAWSDTVRLHLVPRVAGGGRLDLQYAIAVGDPADTSGRSAALAGRRSVGLKPAPLGQMAIGDRNINVDAAAWVMPNRAAQ